MGLKEEQAELWSKKPRSDVERYWESQRHLGRRKWFAIKLRDYKFDSIYEVGCNSGPNLWYVNEAFENKRIGGIDINPEAIKFASEKLPDAEFSVGSLYELDTEDKYDIVFTSGVLLHIPPDQVKSVILKCIEKANKYVIHMETQGSDKVITGPAELNPIKKVKKKLRCVHNYYKIYRDLGYNPILKRAGGKEEEDARHFIIVKVKNNGNIDNNNEL